MRSAPTLGIAILALLFAGCSGPTSGSPTTESATQEGSSSGRQATSTTAQNVPQVTNPIDMAHYKQQPCSALTESQLAKMSITTKPNPRPDAPTGPTCEWDAFDESGLVLGGGPLTAGSSLASSYDKARRGGYQNFKPITAAGYPGYLHWDDGEEDSCVAAVAVRSDLLYTIAATVSEESPYWGKPCQIAKKAVTLATETMAGDS